MFSRFSNLDGTNRGVAVINIPHAFAITLFENSVFWTEWNLKQIQTADKFIGKNVTTLAELIHQPYDIHVVHPLRQPSGECFDVPSLCSISDAPYEPMNAPCPLVSNPCGSNNGGCSHLCLLAPGRSGPRYSCRCPENFVLKSDNKTCTHNCTEAQIMCGTSDQKCVSRFDMCNGVRDCVDGTDEPSTCSEHHRLPCLSPTVMASTWMLFAILDRSVPMHGFCLLPM